jgi:hypothetical protein
MQRNAEEFRGMQRNAEECRSSGLPNTHKLVDDVLVVLRIVQP